MRTTTRFFPRLRDHGLLIALCVALSACAGTPKETRTADGAWVASAPGRYVATQAGWTLEVDAARGRLVRLETPAGSNLLIGAAHRVWLGPQTEWPIFWPPPAHWEEAAARQVLLSDCGQELTLELPEGESGQIPAITRRYRLREGGLELVAAWRPAASEPSFQAVQILQVRPEAKVRVVFSPEPESPLGYGLLPLIERRAVLLDTPFDAEHLIDVQGGQLGAGSAASAGGTWLRFTGKEEKIGVSPQPLLAKFEGGETLALGVASYDGVVDAAVEAPDAGLYTQVYFGATAWAMVEIEQLTPRLRPARADGWVETVMRVEWRAGQGAGQPIAHAASRSVAVE